MKICESNTITRLSLGIAFVLGSAISAEAANIAAYTITGNPDGNNPGDDFTTGFQFEVFQNTTVNAIGAYVRGIDNGGDIFGTPGDPILAAPRTVSIWDVTNSTSPVIQRLITQGDPNTELDLNEDFLYLDLAATGESVELTPGIYRIASFIDGVAGDNAGFLEGQVTFSNTTFVNASPIPNIVQLNGIGYPSQELFPPPAGSNDTEYSISANFLFDDGTNGGPGPTVPEPSLIGGLILFGLGGLLQKRHH